MNEKFLPIGSVCTLKGKNKKIMIMGFYSVQFNGNLKINDYLGCPYPEGLLLPEYTCNFNHSDIENIEFVGYQNDDQKKFNLLLNGLSDDETSRNSNDWVLSSNESYSKLLFDENGVVVLAEPVVSQKITENKYKFDENGIVVSEDYKKTENPFYKDYNTLPKKNEKNPDNNIFSKYKFDENGVVVDEKKEIERNTLNKIEFDENGVVISVGSSESNNNETYEFDENGVVVSVGNTKNELSNEDKKMPNYKFDEKGIVISE